MEASSKIILLGLFLYLIGSILLLIEFGRYLAIGFSMAGFIIQVIGIFVHEGGAVQETTQ